MVHYATASHRISCRCRRLNVHCATYKCTATVSKPSPVQLLVARQPAVNKKQCNTLYLWRSVSTQTSLDTFTHKVVSLHVRYVGHISHVLYVCNSHMSGVRVRVHVRVHVRVRVRMCPCVCTYVFVCVRVCPNVYACVRHDKFTDMVSLQTRWVYRYVMFTKTKLTKTDETEKNRTKLKKKRTKLKNRTKLKKKTSYLLTWTKINKTDKSEEKTG